MPVDPREITRHGNRSSRGRIILATQRRDVAHVGVSYRYSLLFALVGCIPQPGYTSQDYAAAQANAQANANAQVDASMVARIDQARAGAKSGAPNEAWKFAKEVENAFATGTIPRKLDGAALTEEAVGYLDAAAKVEPGQMLAEKGSLLIVAGRKDEGIAALEASFAKPNLWPVAKLLENYAETKPAQVAVVCKKARPVVKSDDERYALLDQCNHWGKGLTWATKADVAFYEEQRAEEERQAAAENAAWREKQDREREQMYASFSKPQTQSPSSSSSSGSSAPSGPVSVTIRSSCGSTVRVFYGDKPKFGSGTTSSISSNSVQSHSFRVGDMMWVVDDHDNGLGSVTISSNTRELTVGCGGISAR